MSNRPAEHSDGDRSTRNAAFGAEIIRFRAIRGHLGPERPLPRRCRTPGRLRRLHRHVAHVLRVRQRPARHQRQRPHRAARPPSRRFGAQRTFASRRSFDAIPKIRRTIDSHHHGGSLAARASENSSMRRRMAASLNRPTAWRRRGVARTAFPEPRSWPRTVHGSGAAARTARGRADAAARAARRRRGALPLPGVSRVFHAP